MHSSLPLLCCATFGAAFVPNVTPSRCGLPGGRHASRCLVPGESSWRASSGFGLDWAISHEVRVHGDGDGSGSISPATRPPSAIAATEAKIEAVEEEIEAVEKETQAVKAALSGGPAYLGISDRGVLLEELEQLWGKEKQLREKKKQLREEKLVRLKPAAAAVSLSADNNVTDFAATLTEAVVTNNTLELVNDTFFLGDPMLGSKLFIRPCHKELSEMILDGASSGALRNIVVTGTPGIGKSVFGLYLLYLLRCQGRTVVFERKHHWYRFSDDEGVQEGLFENFVDARYLTKDPTAWYLSDPEDRPEEMFRGTTVVLVSPKAIRVNEFMKQVKSIQFFMGVWSLGELLECRRAIFPRARCSDVQDAFRDVGGVARAVFEESQLKRLKEEMVTAAESMSLSLDRLRDAVQPVQLHEGLGHVLFHIFQDDTKGFCKCQVTVAGEFAAKSISEQLSKRGKTAIGNWMVALNGDEKLRTAVGPSVWASLFEQYAHSVIAGEPGDGGREFKVNIPTDGLGEGLLSLNFDGRREQFRGETFPRTFNMSTYYVPKSRTFQSIDSFGVDGPSKTIYFFQMKSADVKTVEGDKVEKYWTFASELEIDRCVLVYVVPAGERWERAKKLRDGLPGASDAFKRTCRVCVMGLSFAYGGSVA